MSITCLSGAWVALLWLSLSSISYFFGERRGKPLVLRLRAHISTVTLRFSPSFGSSPVNLALANSKAAMAALAGPSHNSAVKGSINKRHTSGLVGPPGHQTSSVFRQTISVLATSRMTRARPVIDRYALSFGSMKTRPTLGAVSISSCFALCTSVTKKIRPASSVNPCLDRSRAQSASELRGQHANVNLFDNIQDAAKVFLFRHVTTSTVPL